MDEDAVAADRVRQFNERFFGANPGDYFRTRLQLLVIAGARPAELQELLVDGLEYAGLRFTSDASSVEAEPPDLSNFLAIEGQQLLHHAAETVLRLYVAIASGHDVPWIDLAGRRNFAEFKSLVERTFIRDELPAEQVGMVVFGHARPAERLPEPDWLTATNNTRRFLRRFAEVFLDDAALYNAIKHGLGVTSGAATLIVDGHALGGGTSIDYPESGQWRNDEREWSISTRWVDASEALALVDVASQMIDSMWAVGRAVYLDVQESATLFVPVDLEPAGLRGTDRAPARRMSLRLVTEMRHPPSD